jgi:thiol-disulfide isomerase/thioredoxin
MLPIELKKYAGANLFVSGRIIGYPTRDSGFVFDSSAFVRYVICDFIVFKDPSRKLFLLIGAYQDGRLALVLDKNFDKNFKNDSVLIYNKRDYPVDSLNQSYESLPVVELYFYKGAQKTLKDSISIKPIPRWFFPRVTVKNNPFFDSVCFAFETPDCKVGTLSFDGNKHYIYLWNQYPIVSLEHPDHTVFFISDTVLRNKTRPENYQLLHYRDTFTIDGYAFMAKSVSYYKDSLLFEIIGKSDNSGVSINKNAVNFSGKDILTKKSFSLNEMKGRYVLLDFGGSWCEPCKKTIPELKAIFSEASKSNLSIIGVACDKDTTDSQKYIKENNLTWDNIFQSLDNKDEQYILNTYKISAYPTFILIDRNGKIVSRTTGEDGINEIKRILRNQGLL